MTDSSTSGIQRILVLGGTGSIGRAAVAALVKRGHEVVCIARAKAGSGGRLTQEKTTRLLQGAEVLFGDVTNTTFLAEHVFREQQFDAVLSCLASRTGEPKDAWAIDYQAHADVLSLAKESGVTQMILLSAICVQKPRLVFQHAKLKFEQELIESGLTYSIVRPTAYFKSLVGQVDRVKKGKSFLLFGDGKLTACKPISDADLAEYMADCLEDVSLQNKVLPIGGPGPAITLLDQGEYLFKILDRKPSFRSVPASLLSGVAAVLEGLGKVVPPLAAKAELARIGHYYATESMLVLNPETGLYDADATPETGSDTLFEYLQRLIDGSETADRVDYDLF
ncbi:NAD-dependent epimerase/dehydratase family protein [Leptolyngbyaceae cyanobacterium CCMR0082]|uniref:Divinyl chlorophyllide a 8-vinyl-reductase, chloroplastic n=2 Tax=Adonisia turfae TaxID=2950184 RepID=A0A6M0SAH9_9CYAN|nr:NAD(P)H-binding protein [Adonisia turfae]MDV3350071.1 NAD(P)H-binding protein [Leptothoe sp. LEGE 181152]NEZ59167.1 NAD-dependent epimerase/dehydratase family protein [Adonisia turfae CCMR0081]NEZ65306.1 NAD-dependent epimerase/dehydratase family protein [Adonisia turfae CCMR0082]